VKSIQIWVVHETQGGKLVRAFTTEQDAWSFLQWSHAEKELDGRYFTVKPIWLEDWSKK